MLGKPSVQRAQERASAAVEMLPRVLTVQDDRDGGLFPSARLGKAPACLNETMDEVRRGILSSPAGVHEPNQIGESVIAEQARDFSRARLNGIRAVERFWLLHAAL